jgi:hypothetical protein
MSGGTWPEWEHVLSAAAHLQVVLPGATLVPGTAAAVFAGHRISYDADHVLADLRDRFDEVLAQLESVAGWRTARVKRPVLILGSLDGVVRSNDVADRAGDSQSDQHVPYAVAARSAAAACANSNAVRSGAAASLPASCANCA